MHYIDTLEAALAQKERESERLNKQIKAMEADDDINARQQRGQVESLIGANRALLAEAVGFAELITQNAAWSRLDTTTAVAFLARPEVREWREGKGT